MATRVVALLARSLTLAFTGLAGFVTPVSALEINGQALIDARLVIGGGERGWLDGGLGKGRYGEGDAALRVGEAHLLGDVSLLDGLLLRGHVRAEIEQKTVVDVIEVYARWQPSFEGRSRPLTVKLGAFFPPISLENDGVAWSALYTISPSAINSWVGEELRTIGAEATYVWQPGRLRVDMTGAVFGWNDPAGTLLADRGWALHDRWAGLIESTRLPDNFGPGGRGPARLKLFREIDDRPGYYAGITLRHRGWPRLSVLWYDNNADSTALRVTRAWDTRFWNIGLDMRLTASMQLLTQTMVGRTIVTPNAVNRRDTDFYAFYLLLGYTDGDWTYGGRIDLFGSDENTRAARAVRFGEHGKALTASASRRLGDHLSVAGEVLHTDSYRAHRRLFGEGPDRADTRAQLMLRATY